MADIARTPRQLGAVIQRERRLQNLSQTELADRAGLRQELISKIESGNPGTRINTICDLLGALKLELVIARRARGSASEIEDIF